MVKHFATTSFTYKPKRGAAGPEASSWADRFLAYQWRKAGPFSTLKALLPIEDILCAAVDVLENGTSWAPNESVQIAGAVEKLFEWGGVSRGKGHRNPDIDVIRAVMLTAMTGENKFGAPLDSAWTKLAAVCSSRLANPHVIFDSRVSISLLRAIERATLDHGHVQQLAPGLKSALGLVPGRGGSRPQHISDLRSRGWKWGYGKWSCQFAASQIVREMAAVLNYKREFGPMPVRDGGSSSWTVRGVEMVLFMDGY
ncbi:hypothetical protein IP79_05955 [Porphyrobacter sp. AAP60]|nr:hypothetical protein IP79_05955 [Porphyrobacter sp. AAP60]